MVETQRLESMRAAEARANSFLNPYSKGGKIFMMMEIAIMVMMILLIMLIFLGNKDDQNDVELYYVAQKSSLDPLRFGFFLPSSTFWFSF